MIYSRIIKLFISYYSAINNSANYFAI